MWLEAQRTFQWAGKIHTLHDVFEEPDPELARQILLTGNAIEAARHPTVADEEKMEKAEADQTRLGAMREAAARGQPGPGEPEMPFLSPVPQPSPASPAELPASTAAAIHQAEVAKKAKERAEKHGDLESTQEASRAEVQRLQAETDEAHQELQAEQARQDSHARGHLNEPVDVPPGPPAEPVEPEYAEPADEE